MMLVVEVGGSGIQAVWFDDANSGSIVSLDGHRHHQWLLAAPGLVEGDRVRGAHHLDWMDVQPSKELSMHAPPVLSMNDADAAALGEWVLRGQPKETLFYISIGTGVGATAVIEGELIPVEFGHLTAFGPKRCRGCGRVGCLDAQIGGHTLPTPLGDSDITKVVTVLQAALDKQEIVVNRIVLGGGLPRRYPQIVSLLGQRTDQSVEPSATPPRFKSAAPFGLLDRWGVQLDGILNHEPGHA